MATFTLCIVMLSVFFVCGHAAASPLFSPLHARGNASKSQPPAEPTEARVVTIPLQKQLVPVRRNNVVVSHKTAYFGTIRLGAGDRSQEFSMVFDTGSGHVIVPSDSCKSESCLSHRRFSSKESPSATDINIDGSSVSDIENRDEVTVGFGIGEVVGNFASETVCLGAEGSNGDGGQARCAKGMKIVMGIEMSQEPFNSFAFDGVVGLGLSALALDPSFSFFGQMASQGRIVNPHFGLFLADNDDSESEISFGGVNKARLQSPETPMNWSPVVDPELGYWQIRVKGLRIGGQALDFCNSGDCNAIVDTGTSHFGVPGTLITDLQEMLSSYHTGNDTVDCRDATLPDVHIELEGFTLSLRTKDYARRLPFPFAGSSPLEESKRVCRPRLMRVGLPAPLSPKTFILGEPILRRYYSLFNYGEKKVGFGLAKQDDGADDLVVMMQIKLRVRRRPSAFLGQAAKQQIYNKMTLLMMLPMEPC